jgi:hypothetical protein
MFKERFFSICAVKCKQVSSNEKENLIIQKYAEIYYKNSQKINNKDE